MSGPFGSSQWMYSSGGFYPYAIDNSLRFNDDDSAYLTRTPSSAGNRKTWTWSGWVKRGNLGTLQGLFHCYDGAASRRSSIVFNTDNTIGVDQGGSSTSGLVDTVAVFRDTSAWYHIVVRADYSNGTASDRVKIYVNGVLQSVSTSDDFDNADGLINSTNAHELGSFDGSGQFLDGYMADVNFIDGTALDPTSFGETKSGIWIPKKYSGSYNTNGFYLKFAGNPNDSSGNSNNWTANNISSHDYMPDSPTNFFATFNPLDNIGTSNFSEGNLKVGSSTGSVTQKTRSTFAVSQNFYFEAYKVDGGTQNFNVGVATATADIGSTGNTGVYTKNYSGGTGDILMFAYSASANALWTGLNGTWDNSATVAEIEAGTTTNATHTGIADEAIAAVFIDQATSYSGRIIANFGQDSTFAGGTTAGGNTDANGVGDFKYAPPSGLSPFLALCSNNLPAPAIDPADDDTPEDYFNTVLYTGNSGTNAITGVGFQPDFVWVKSRNDTYNHELYDVIRGQQRLYSNLTSAEDTGSLTSFDSDGFTHTSGSIGGNASGTTYASWNWKAGGTAVSNTDGSITSQVSANTKAGFSIASYTGNGLTNQSIGHGLNNAPEMMIVKARSFGPSAWSVYTAKTGAGDELLLNTTAASATAANVWNNTAPTSSVFTVGTAASTNQNTATYIAYIFHSVEGYSKVGSYTGNGSSDGPFVYTGFRPTFVITKFSSSTGNWVMFDAERNNYNVIDDWLLANSSNAEGTGTALDFLSNGFKLRASGSGWNDSGTYIYLAFGQSFKYANAR